MGSGRWDADDWKSHTTTRSYATKSTSEIYTSRDLKKELDPNAVMRESCDSVDNPNSTPIIVGLDVTGSMGRTCDAIARKGLNEFITQVHKRKPVKDPHVLISAIGDPIYDKAPLQVTQFEADVRLVEQLETIWLEGGGGGNSFEGYALAWYFALHHTKTDSFKKRGKKGYIFTMGDEWPTPRLTRADIKKVFGNDPERDFELDELINAVSKEWEIYHLVITESNNGDSSFVDGRGLKGWSTVLGERAIKVTDHTKVAEVIVSLMQANEGVCKEEILKSWDGSTSVVVRDAIGGLTVNKEKKGLVTL